MNRCPAINKNNKWCRNICENRLFCCKSHEPINKELIEEGCFICSEKIIQTNEILYFKCKHAFHKDCYYEWMKYSTYNNMICLICRKDFIFNKKKKNTIKYERVYLNNENPIFKINTLHKNDFYNFYK
jgi:hypothetical protein